MTACAISVAHAFNDDLMCSLIPQSYESGVNISVIRLPAIKSA
jgi:hypothetical protein